MTLKLVQHPKTMSFRVYLKRRSSIFLGVR